MIYIFIWWFILQLLGLIALPITYHLFQWLPDRGYAFTKAFGLLLISYFVWMGAMTGILTNTSGGIVIALLATISISGTVTWLGQKSGTYFKDMLAFWRRKKASIIIIEALFLLAFIAWASVRAYTTFKIAPAGGEKFMEMAFLNGILQSPRFPPLDPWLSNFSISYYYFGYVMMGVLTKLSGAPAGVAFDLYDALLFALTIIGTFGVIYNLVPAAQRAKDKPANPSQPIGYGLLGALLLAVMGNLEGFLEGLHSAGWLPTRFFEWLNIKDLAQAPANGSFYPGNNAGWWWWRASRVVLDRTLTGESLNDSNITEFPFFSFQLGDNHPHVLNLPFVLLALGLALNLLRATLANRKNNAESEDCRNQLPWWNPMGAFSGSWAHFLGYAFCLGALGFLNTWDFPIYIIVTVMTFGVGLYALQRQVDRFLVGRVIALGTGLLLAGTLFYALFYITFRSQAGGILPFVQPPTRLPHYLVMFGPFIFVTLIFLLITLWRSAKAVQGVWKKTILWWLGFIATCAGTFTLLTLLLPAISSIRQAIQGALENAAVQEIFGNLTLAEAVPALLIARLNDPWVFLLLTGAITLAISNIYWNIRLTNKDRKRESLPQQASTGLLFACVLLFCGLGLTLSVEFVYLRDVFGNRMNTIFKFYYQAWVMLACASTYGIWWINNRGVAITGQAIKYTFQVITTLLIAGGMAYPVMATLTKTDKFSNDPIPPNLDGASSIARENPDDWAAITWLHNNAGTSSKGNFYNVPVILEAPGKSYDYKGRISAFTGLPAVLGWAGHELQWRGNYDEQGKREVDIQGIFATHNPQEMLDLLNKWQVDYVVIGNIEHAYIQEICTTGIKACNPQSALRKFNAVLTPVYNEGEIIIYQVP